MLLGASWGDLGGSGLGTCNFLRVWATQDESGHPLAWFWHRFWAEGAGIGGELSYFATRDQLLCTLERFGMRLFCNLLLCT